MATDVCTGGGARGESRPPDGGRVAARARARRRACDERPLASRSRSPVSARARCRRRCSSRRSARTGSGSRRSSRTSAAGSGRPRRARGCGPISPPEYDFELPTTDKEPWSFSATIEVQPTPEIVDWTTLEVPRAEVEVPQELVDQELEALRQSVAELVPADDRPAKDGDTLVVDLQSPSGEAQSDTVVELGSGRLVEEIEAALIGASVGETKEVDYELADESGAAVDDHGQARQREGAARARRRACALGERVRHASPSCGPISKGACAQRSRRRSTPPSGRPPSTRSSPRRTSRAPGRSSRRGRVSCSTASCARWAGAGSSPTTYFEVTGQSPEVLVAQMQGRGGPVGRARARARGGRREGRDRDLRRRRQGADPRAGRGSPATIPSR